MKSQSGIILSIILICLNFTICFSQGWLKEYILDSNLEETKGEINFYEVQKWAIEHFAETEKEISRRHSNGETIFEGDGKDFAHYIKYKRWEWYWSSRINADGSLGYPHSSIIQKIPSSSRTADPAPQWTYIGIQNAEGGYWGMGRAECMGFHPTDINTFYVGSHGGGVWKTIDGGQTYIPIGDQLPITQIGEILVDFENPQIVYISLGPRGGWTNKSMGVYKSLDGGNSWQATSFSYEYEDGYAIEDMVMSQTNPSIILVARENGIWRTENGGDTWSQVAVGYFNDLAWKPGSNNVVYATKYDPWGSSEVFKSTNGGLNWNQITALNIRYNQLRIAVTPANPNMLSFWSGSEIKIYTSKNEGAGFVYKGDSEHNMFPIFISPNNENIMYAGGLVAHQSTDGGINWIPISHWHGGNNLPEVHADVRNIYSSPIDPDILYFCNDGGIYTYEESINKWTELTTGLHIAQYYRLAVAQSDPEITTCGSQDNGGSRRNTDKSWKNTNGGDAMVQQIDPNDADIMYTTYINGELFRSFNGGNSFNNISSYIPGGKPPGDWVTPYQLDPSNSSVIYAGYDNVWKSENRGTSWTRLTNGLTGGVIHDLKVAPSNSNVIYISRSNRLWKTENGGLNWTQLTSPGGQRITRIAIDPNNENNIWAVQAGWIDGQKCFRSIDGGASWINMTLNLPNVPTNVVLLMEGPQNGIYIGNDVGVYYKNSSMTEWIKYGDGLPNTTVNDLAIQLSSGVLRAATWGRGLWEIPIFEEGNTIDCNGDLNGTAFFDDCGVCAGGNTGIPINSSCCNPGRIVKIKKWNGVSGGATTDIPVSTPPDQLLNFTEIDFPEVNNENYFGVQLTAFLCPPETGEYTFYIASDDNSKLYLSNDTTSENKVLIAYVDGYTPYQNFDQYSSQKSNPVMLEEGKLYYLEMLMKEDGGGEHFSVAWKRPGGTIKVLQSNFLYQNLDCNGDLNGTAFLNNCEICVGGNTGVDINSNCCNSEGIVKLKKWTGIPGGATSDIPVSTSYNQLLSFYELDFPIENNEDNFGVQLNAFLCPPESGSYTFWIASDDQSQLYLSPDTTIENKILIAAVDGWTTYRDFNKYNSQQSSPLMLESGQKYYLEMLMKESGGGEHFSVAWQKQGGVRKILKAGYLSQHIDCNGDFYGSAYLDSCNICVGGNTGIEKCIQDCNGVWGGDAVPGSPCNDGTYCTTNDYYNTNCECLGSPSYTIPSYTITDATCEELGKISFSYTNHWKYSNIFFSLDSGITYPLISKGSSGTVSIDTLKPGKYQLSVRWSELECYEYLGNVTISRTTQGACDDGDICTTNDSYNAKCECIGEKEYPTPSYTITNATCESQGKIIFNFTTSPDHSQIEFSLDSGQTYPLVVSLNNGTAFIDTLSAGNYEIMARWSEEDCPVHLGSETVSLITGGACDDGDICTTNDSYNAKCECIGEKEYPTPSYTITNATCESQGKIIFNFTPSPDHSQIEFSLDGGQTYPLVVSLNNGTAFIDTLSAEKYEIMARWSKDDCPVHLGSVTISFIAGGTCDDDDECTLEDQYDENCNCIGNISTDCITGINESKDNKILFFPNPASSEIRIKSVNDQCPDRIWIHDIRGVLHKFKYDDCIINIENLPSGLYILAVDLEGVIYQQKILIGSQ